MRTLIIAVLWLCTHFAFATHLRSGEISVRQIGAYSTIVKITITVYTNEGSLVEFGGIPGEEDILDFGDGTSMLVPEQKSTHRPDLGPLIGVAQYTVLHHYRARGQYLISYREPNRNEGVLNMDNSVNTRFFIKTLVTVGDESFTTPAFHAPPIFKAISGSAYNCSLAGDHDDDVQLYYTLSPSFDAMDVPVKNYKIPSEVELNPVTGIFSWDTSAAGHLLGEYNFAVIVYQVKDEKLIGYSLRDFQIVFIEENIPEVTIEDDVALDNNNRIFIAAEENKTIKLAVGTEEELDISIDVYSKLKGEHVTVEIYDSIGTSKVFKVAAINLRNAEAIERDSPYPIQIRVSINTGRLTIQRDLNYLFYTRDVEYNDLPLILSADSFEEESRSDVIAYPNPFDGFISFKNEEEILAFTLTDASGKLIFQRASQVEAPVKMPAELLPGIYTCTVKTRRGTAQFKLVKK